MSATQGALAPVIKLGYVEVRTQDVDAIVTHYRDVIGLRVVLEDDSGTYLSTGAEHHCLLVTKGDPHGRASIGMQLDDDIGACETRLREGGIAVERRSDPQPGVAEALVISEPGTDIPIALYEAMGTVNGETPLGCHPSKLGHVASFNPELGKTQDFFEGPLGFRWSDTVGDFFIFLRCNADHHAVNFMQSTKRSGLHHVAFETRDIVHLKDMLDQLAKHDVRLNWGPGRHGPGHNIFSYHSDPDGNQVELFTEIDHILDERDPMWEPRPWHEEFPMGPKVWELKPETPNMWGPINAEQLDH